MILFCSLPLQVARRRSRTRITVIAVEPGSTQSAYRCDGSLAQPWTRPRSTTPSSGPSSPRGTASTPPPEPDAATPPELASTSPPVCTTVARRRHGRDRGARRHHLVQVPRAEQHQRPCRSTPTSSPSTMESRSTMAWKHDALPERAKEQPASRCIRDAKESLAVGARHAKMPIAVEARHVSRSLPNAAAGGHQDVTPAAESSRRSRRGRGAQLGVQAQLQLHSTYSPWSVQLDVWRTGTS